MLTAREARLEGAREASETRAETIGGFLDTTERRHIAPQRWSPSDMSSVGWTGKLYNQLWTRDVYRAEQE